MIRIKNNKKAWGARTPCFYFVSALVLGACLFVAPVAMAQNNDLTNRLQRLENEIDTLNRAVYKGEKPPQQIYTNNNASTGTSDAQSNAQMEIRLQQIETQMRDLTGKVEEQIYTINQLKNDVGFLQNKVANMPATNTPDTSAADNNNGGITRTPAARLEPTPVVDTPPVNNASPSNPLNLDLSAQEPTGMQVASPIASTSKATAKYEAAYALIQDKKYKDARSAFDMFLKEHPNHVLSANAKYWLGETYYVDGDYGQAARAFAQGFQKFPDSAKSPDMLLKLGLSLANLEKTEEACIALAQLPVKFKAGPKTILDRGEQERSRLNCSAE